MTEPTQPNDQTLLVATGVEEVKKNADSLDLQWKIRYATVVSVSDGIVDATYDGDATSVPMISLIGDIVIGARVAAISVPPSGNYIIGTGGTSNLATSVENYNGINYNITGTTYHVGGATFCAVAFVAPYSGKVTVHTSAQMNNSTASAYVSVAPQVATGVVFGAGTVVTGGAASYDNAAFIRGSTDTRKGVSQLISGLTPGADYNATLYHAVTAGTGFIERRRVTVIPAQ